MLARPRTSTVNLFAGQAGCTVLIMVRWETFEARRGATPVYRQLSTFIAAEIEAGHLEPGDQIPAERRLAELTGVSVDTVRAAVAALRDMGLVETSHGLGTFALLFGHAVQGQVLLK